jgi:hypothetical protein
MEGEKMIYKFGYRFTARYSVTVKSNSLKEAKEIAEDNYLEADFGEAEDIDGKITRTIDNYDETYKVVFRFSARYITEVKADDIEKAKVIAEEKYTEADFGEAEDIDGELRFIEDEQGRRILDKTVIS